MEINGNSQLGIVIRLNKYIADTAFSTPSAFAIRAGIDPSGFHKMLKGQLKISAATLKKISDAYDLNIEWLKTGEGPMLRDAEPEVPQISYTDGVPFYDVDFRLGFSEIGFPESERPEYLMRVPGYERATLWCRTSGDSMKPEINSGDIIALQLIEDPSFLLYGEIYGIITTTGLRTIKRLGRSDRDDCYKLIPTNPEYDSQDIPISKILRVFRVMGAIKPF